MAGPDITEKSRLQRLMANRRSPLHQLLEQSDQLTRLQKHVTPLLPIELQQHVTVAGVREGDLLLLTDSGVWASRLRQLQTELIRTLRAQLPGYGIERLSIKVRPRSSTKKTGRKANPISQKNAQLLEEEARQTKDEGLKRVLLSLARHTKDGDDTPPTR